MTEIEPGHGLGGLLDLETTLISSLEFASRAETEDLMCRGWQKAIKHFEKCNVENLLCSAQADALFIGKFPREINYVLNRVEKYLNKLRMLVPSHQLTGEEERFIYTHEMNTKNSCTHAIDSEECNAAAALVFEGVARYRLLLVKRYRASRFERRLRLASSRYTKPMVVLAEWFRQHARARKLFWSQFEVMTGHSPESLNLSERAREHLNENDGENHTPVDSVAGRRSGMDDSDDAKCCLAIAIISQNPDILINELCERIGRNRNQLNGNKGFEKFREFRKKLLDQRARSTATGVIRRGTVSRHGDFEAVDPSGST